VRNLVTVTAADAIAWNGRPVSETDLATLLQEAAALRPEPELELAPDARASYDRSARVLRLVKLSGATRVGFVGNERYRDFGR
jgi:biopolymer transport protein ExbD